MDQKVVSVVMCTYNGSKYLDEQISSILNQNYKDLELIIVDDNSSDDTWLKLKDWQKKDERICIYRNEVNIGYNKNFEKAISLAGGSLIAISDQDDIWLPSKIEKQVSAFRDSKVILAHTRSVRLESGRLRFKSASLHRHYKGNDTRKLFMFNQVNGHDMMFRKELVSKAFPIPDYMMYDWWIAVIATCFGNIASVDEYLVHHRIHDLNSFFTTKTKESKKELDVISALQIFTSLDCLKSESKMFLQELLKLLTAHQEKVKVNFDYPLFKFLYKHRKIIFGHRKRMVVEISYLKWAIKYAKMDYRGKGLSI